MLGTGGHQGGVRGLLNFLASACSSLQWCGQELGCEPSPGRFEHQPLQAEGEGLLPWEQCGWGLIMHSRQFLRGRVD